MVSSQLTQPNIVMIAILGIFVRMSGFITVLAAYTFG
jgi:hypothetical protein